MRDLNFMFSLVEHEKFITFGSAPTIFQSLSHMILYKTSDPHMTSHKSKFRILNDGHFFVFEK